MVCYQSLQEELPKLTGHALKTLSNFDRPDTRTYSSWDTVLDRYVLVVLPQLVPASSDSALFEELFKDTFRWMACLTESLLAF